MANTVKTTFIGDAAPLQKTQAQIKRDADRYAKEQERREKEITRAFETEARKRAQQEQKLLRDAEREQNRIVKERERQEREITRNTQREIKLREQAQREADADAKFRIQTLENFRQGVAARQAGPGGGSVFSRLTYQQKTQLSFQANDVISGLAMGQSPFQILAQQGGQIVQVFQQTKVTQEGVVKATTAAATAQAAFAANSRQAAVEIAKGHQSMTLLGASAIGLGAIAAAGLVTIGAVYKATRDIEEAAQRRLATEKAIQGVLNEQYLTQVKFKKELEGDAADRDFRAVLAAGQGNPAYLQTLLSRTVRTQEEEFNRVSRDLTRRGVYASALGLRSQEELDRLGIKNGLSSEAYINQGKPAGYDERQERLRKQIKELTAELDQARRDAPSSVDRQIQEQALQSARNAREAELQAYVKRFEDQQKNLERVLKKRNATVAELQKGLAAVMRTPLTEDTRADLVQRFNDEIEQALERQKKKLEEVERAKNSLFDSALSGSQNPFVQQLGRMNSEMRQLLETAKDLSPALREAFVADAQRRNRNQLAGLRIDNSLDVISLQEQARDFKRGFRQGDEAEILRQAQRRLFPNYSSAGAREAALQKEIEVQRELVQKEKAADLDKRLRVLSGNDPIANAKLVQFAQNLDPASLNYNQRQQVTSAFEREADRKLRFEENANDFYTQMKEVISKDGLKVTVKDSNLLDITITDEKNLTTAGTSGNVNARYPNR